LTLYLIMITYHRKERPIMKNIKAIIICSLSLVFLNSNSQAGVASVSTKASATLAKTCSVASANLNFGNLAQTTSTPQMVMATSNLTVLCSKNVSYTISQSIGVWGSVDANRQMQGQIYQDRIVYFICRAPGFSTSSYNCNPQSNWWFNGYTVSEVGTGLVQNIPVYGYAKTGYFTPDTYADTITTTITY
jgi:spore coat protein U-like protein